MGITHSKVSGVTDSADTSLVRPSDWNADHVVPWGVAGDIGVETYSAAAAAGATGKIADAGHIHPMPASGGGGGGGSGLLAPDGKPYNFTPPTSANAKDDEFSDLAGQSGPVNGLDAKWSKHNLGTATWLRLDDTYAPGALGFDLPSSQPIDQYIYQAVPAGSWTVQYRMTFLYGSDRQMWGGILVNTSGNGVGVRWDSSDFTPRMMLITAWQQTGSTTDFLPIYSPAGAGFIYLPITIWMRWDDAAGRLYASASFGDRVMRPMTIETFFIMSSFTPAYFAFGREYGTGQSKVILDYWRVS